MKDYYNILGISKNATEVEIKKAYKALAIKHHPDRNPDDKEAEEKMKEINEAYETLSNSDKRSQYDNGDDMFNFDRVREHMRRESERMKPKGRNIRVNIEVSLDEIKTGVNKEIRYVKDVLCETCNGLGGDEFIGCDVCGGSGLTKMIRNTQFGRMVNVTTCNHCHGEGQIPKNSCNTCGGWGTKKKQEILKIKIPKGIEDGEILIAQGKGSITKNGIPGDLLVCIVEKYDERFKRLGLDLYKNVKISYPKLVLGTKIMVETLDKKVEVKIPPRTNVGKNLRLKGMGLERDNYIGDVILEVDLDMPKEISDEEKILLEEMVGINSR